MATTTRKRKSRREERIERMELVSNEPFRDFYLRVAQHRDTPTEIAARAGFYHGGRRADGSKVGDASYLLRLLGLKESPSKTGYPSYVREWIPYETGVKLADALGLDYHEAGV